MQSIETTRPVQANGAPPSLLGAGDNTFGMVSNTSRMRTSSPPLPESNSAHREPVVLRHADWSSHNHPWSGVIEGANVGTNVTVLFYTTEQIGEGPRLHVHPYDESFIIRRGQAMFTIGDKTVAAQAGDILFGPANVPHNFYNLGPGVLETTDIHVSKQWVQTNLQDSANPQ